jgi:hypothetical protein
VVDRGGPALPRLGIDLIGLGKVLERHLVVPRRNPRVACSDGQSSE